MPLDSTGYLPERPDRRDWHSAALTAGYVFLVVVLVGLMVVSISLAALTDAIGYLQSH